MTRALMVSMPVFFGLLLLAPSVRAGTLVEFEGGIGVDPVSRADVVGITTVAVRNIVREVPPGAQPWVIERFKAKVKDDGRSKAEGKGLVQAGGNSIGTPGAVGMVGATLFCGTSPHSSDPVPLEPDGDFKIKDTLDPLPLEDPCVTPVLLIRAGSSAGPWIAAGIPED